GSLRFPTSDVISSIQTRIYAGVAHRLRLKGQRNTNKSKVTPVFFDFTGRLRSYVFHLTEDRVFSIDQVYSGSCYISGGFIRDHVLPCPAEERETITHFSPSLICPQ
ncbi:unnamed protein product, partial [Scytosiphon promiscuus]